ncbi:LVIVD repeat-containing protein [Rhodocytophaga aerolata]
MKIMFKQLFVLSQLCLATLWLGSCSMDSSNAPVSPGNNGIGGSMARFAVVGNHLYTVNNTSLQIYDISQPADPIKGNVVKLGVGIETIFPYANQLFIGSQTGMHIYDNQNPDRPTLVSRYDHVQSCDPVVVQGNYAYVTLRDGNTCRTGQNLLDVVDISNLSAPKLVQSYPMKHPHGLGIDGDILFVCEGQFGLKVFDASDPANLVQTQFIPGVKSYDVIPHNQVLLLTGEDGLYQYRYTDPQHLELLSKIPVAVQ